MKTLEQITKEKEAVKEARKVGKLVRMRLMQSYSEDDAYLSDWLHGQIPPGKRNPRIDAMIAEERTKLKASK